MTTKISYAFSHSNSVSGKKGLSNELKLRFKNTLTAQHAIVTINKFKYQFNQL